jgi:hypothetical protein
MLDVLLRCLLWSRPVTCVGLVWVGASVRAVGWLPVLAGDRNLDALQLDVSSGDARRAAWSSEQRCQLRAKNAGRLRAITLV